MLDSPLVRRARDLAREAHDGQTRKASDEPYFNHPDGVARLLVEHGHDAEITLAAAYLHDVLEDQPAFSVRLQETFPEEVLAPVRLLTEKKLDAAGQKRPKRDRFRDYVRGLSGEGEGVRRARVVSCADKVHNVESLVAAEREGLGLLASLNTHPGEHEGKLASLRPLYAEVVTPALLARFDRARRTLFETIQRWVPGRAIAIAAEAHLGRFDADGRPAIDRGLEAALGVEDEALRLALTLYGVLDTGRVDDLRLRRDAVPAKVRSALAALRRHPDESDEVRVTRILGDWLATRVEARVLERSARPADAAHLARLRDALEARYLYVVLDEASQEAVRALAHHAVVRGDHVTLHPRTAPSAFDPGWVPGDAALGAEVEFRAIASARDARVQALVVEIGGTSERPFDGGVLHVTVSHALDARSSDSNALLAGDAHREPLDLSLRGEVRWVDRG